MIDDGVVKKSSSAGSTDGFGGVYIKPNKDIPLSQLNEGPRWEFTTRNQSLEGLKEKFEEDALFFEMFMSGGVSEERKAEIGRRIAKIEHQKIARWDKPFTADSDDELQNALILHGATHLRRVHEVEQTGQYETVTDVVLAVLLAEYPDPRFTAALGPILIKWADWVDFQVLEIKLKSVSKLRRLGWLVENIVAASSGQLLPCSLYPRLIPPKSPPLDMFDLTIRSEKTFNEVWNHEASPISKKWGIVTTLQVEDFARMIALT